MKQPATAVGCRVKSGWAMTVLLSGPATAPRVLDRCRIALSDPAVPESVQPYHAGFGTERTDSAAVARLTRIVIRSAEASLRDLVQGYRAMGHHPKRMGIVVGSLVDPSTIANQHIRAHAQEGRLFRTVVADAARDHSLRSEVFLERELFSIAAELLGGSPLQVQRRATELGRTIEGSWRAEEKSAAVAAWIVLARRGATTGRRRLRGAGR